jgi:import inner membrane translocase subunit TIM44
MTVDPNFDLENFLRELREYIVPDILDAFHSSDKITLRQWCSEATFNVLNEGFKSQEQQGLIPDSQILDLRRVDVS